jgi:hypothetical protein
MNVLLLLLGILVVLGSMVAWFMVLYEAWQDEAWKAILGFFIPLYLLYYTIAELDHEHKWLLFLLMLFGSGLGGTLIAWATSAG